MLNLYFTFFCSVTLVSCKEPRHRPPKKVCGDVVVRVARVHQAPSCAARPTTHVFRQHPRRRVNDTQEAEKKASFCLDGNATKALPRCHSGEIPLHVHAIVTSSKQTAQDSFWFFLMRRITTTREFSRKAVFPGQILKEKKRKKETARARYKYCSLKEMALWSRRPAWCQPKR